MSEEESKLQAQRAAGGSVLAGCIVIGGLALIWLFLATMFVTFAIKIMS